MFERQAEYQIHTQENAVVAFRSWTQMTILKPLPEGVTDIPNLNKENVRQLLTKIIFSM